jgi:hypothetical protein
MEKQRIDIEPYQEKDIPTKLQISQVPCCCRCERPTKQNYQQGKKSQFFKKSFRRRTSARKFLQLKEAKDQIATRDGEENSNKEKHREQRQREMEAGDATREQRRRKKIPHLPTSRERTGETFRSGISEPKSESKCKYRKLGLPGLRYPHLVPNL